jgi:hypothetical protein
MDGRYKVSPALETCEKLGPKKKGKKKKKNPCSLYNDAQWESVVFWKILLHKTMWCKSIGYYPWSADALICPS